uniref:cytochrome c oxidase subunit 2 n=1 Tax=Glauconome virens TaxID=457868 RepID=UPI00315DD9F0
MSIWSQLGFPDPKTENAKNLILYHDMTLVVVAMILVLVVWFLVIFLFKKIFFGGMMNRYVHSNDWLEIIWTVSPAFILFVLGYVSLVNLYQMELGDGSEHLVKVTGHQWYWDYEYLVDVVQNKSEFSSWLGNMVCVLIEGSDDLSGQIEFGSEASGSDDLDDAGVFESWENMVCLVKGMVKVVGEWDLKYDSFMIPAGDIVSDHDVFPFESGFRNADVTNPCFLARSVPNEVLVSTVDVMHSWGLTELGVKVDAIPGRINCLGVIPYSSGVSYGNCYELCGVGHSTMPIKVVILNLNDLKGLLVQKVLESDELTGS